MTGGCLCGGVRFEVEGEPTVAGYCHCTRCQRRTGTAASVSVHMPPGAVKITSGEKLLKAWNAGEGWDKVFCSQCGAHLFSRDPASGRTGIRMSALDEDPGIPLSYRQYTAYAASWEEIPDDGLQRFPEARP